MSDDRRSERRSKDGTGGAERLARLEAELERLRDEVRHLRRELKARASDPALAELRARAEEAQRARARAEAAERRSAFLAEAGSILAASLDLRHTLESLARLAVPTLADWCVVDIRAENGTLQRIAVASADPEKAELAREYRRRYPPDPSAEEGVGKVLRTGEPVLWTEVPEDVLERGARDAEHLALLRRLGLVSVMIVPMIARGHAIGAITFASAESGRRFDERDVELADELAHRAALAAENARLYAAALVASQAKTDFLAVISHELRTPLNAIIGYTELLEMGVPVPLPQEAKTQVERVRTAAAQLLQLIEEVLSFSRLELDREEIRFERVRITDLLREVAGMIEPIASGEGLDFRISDPGDARPALLDRAKTRQVLLNLLNNAVKFTERGHIELGASDEADRVVFWVRDTGIGIPEEHLDDIFQPFWQVERSTTRRRGGTGLGLTVARRLTELMGGELRVESEPGVGSTFTVSLPRRARRGVDDDRK